MGRSVRWFAELAYGELGKETELEVGHDDLQAIERVDILLRQIGFNGSGFARRTKKLAKRLAKTDPTPFEEGVTELGRLLGWDANHPGGTASPDSVWIASERLALVWEAKSDESADGEVGANTARQAASHVAWLRTHHQMTDDAVVIPILVSDRTRLSEAALPHTGDVRVVTIGEIRALADETVAALARIRSLGEAEGDGSQRSRLMEHLMLAGLLPSGVVDRLASRELAALA